MTTQNESLQNDSYDFRDNWSGQPSISALATTTSVGRFRIGGWKRWSISSSSSFDEYERSRSRKMCRNIKPLFNFDPPVTAEEIRAASLQFVRKISGFNKPSKANESSFLAAVDDIAAISSRLLRSLETNASPRNREEEAARAKARAAERFGA
jgi:hypothetical protein